jgi:hypothetical protein
MTTKTVDEFFRTHTEEEIWQRYCGFLDLSVKEFMAIQEQLLMEQIDLVHASFLGKKIIGNHKPASVEEYRQIVPLTTYDDYEPYLSERREDLLAEKPLFWSHTSGRGGTFKWFPYTHRAMATAVTHIMAITILSAAPGRGRVIPHEGDRLLFNLASLPYISGYAFYYLARHATIHTMPPLEKSDTMDFQERIKQGFQMALRTGVDEIFSISSVLVTMGLKMSEQAQCMKFSPFMLHPAVLFRLSRAWIHAKTAKRGMLPRDLWPAKALITTGTDTAIYKDDISFYWGQTPYEFYGSTEAVSMATQNWNKKGMTFFPDTAFWEFIPEEESRKSRDDKKYQPLTVTLDELQAGKNYELVFTRFYGVPLLRYRIGDILTVAALEDEETGTTLPQITFRARVGEIIKLSGLTELDEKTIWQAISATGIKCEEWSACKEYDHKQTYLRLYLELKGHEESPEIEGMIDEQLRIIDKDYRDLYNLLKLQPVRVTALSPGTFQRYYDQKRKEGADLAHLKPLHVNAPETAIQQLLQLSQQNRK